MLLKLAPVSKEMDLKTAKRMAHNIAVTCFLSDLDAKHIVNTAVAKGQAFIYTTKKEHLEALQRLADEAGFTVEWYSSEKLTKV